MGKFWTMWASGDHTQTRVVYVAGDESESCRDNNLNWISLPDPACALQYTHTQKGWKVECLVSWHS